MPDRRRVYWESARPDISRLPPHLREQAAPTPLSEFEVRSRIVIFKNPVAKGLNHPTGRVNVVAHQPDEENVDKYEGLAINLMDFKGHAPLACAIIATEHFEKLFEGFIQEYERSGGKIEKLQEILERQINDTGNNTESNNASDVQSYWPPRK